jgi:hypothetical protein
VFVCAAVTCAAGQWEIGASFGYGIYRNGTLFAPAGQARAGIRNRFALSVAIGENLYSRLSGEFRYTYQDGDPFIEAAGVQTNLQGQSHAFHYDLLLHARPRWARIRPYLAGGLGVKWFVVTGPENPSQPFSKIGLLTATRQVEPLVSVSRGGHARLRFDFRDYITRFPDKIIQPAPQGTGHGMLQQFTPMAGVSFGF